MARKIKLVYQSSDTSCGPAVISMISGISEKKILEMLGYRFDKGLDPKYVSWILKKLNISCSGWLRGGLWPFSKKAILVCNYFNNFNCKWIDGHFIVFYKNKFYDPYWGVRKNLVHWSLSNDWVKVKKYIDIYD